MYERLKVCVRIKTEAMERGEEESLCYPWVCLAAEAVHTSSRPSPDSNNRAAISAAEQARNDSTIYER